jgi:hypothetical protein
LPWKTKTIERRLKDEEEEEEDDDAGKENSRRFLTHFRRRRRRRHSLDVRSRRYIWEANLRHELYANKERFNIVKRRRHDGQPSVLWRGCKDDDDARCDDARIVSHEEGKEYRETLAVERENRSPRVVVVVVGRK